MLVDFQICHLVPISYDLIYAIYMLMEPEHRVDLGYDSINHYHSVLKDTLHSIGYKAKIPTETEIWEQVHRGKYYHFFMISTLLPLMVAVKSNSLKMHELLQDATVRKKSYTLDIYTKDVARVLSKIEELGYFENL